MRRWTAIIVITISGMVAVPQRLSFAQEGQSENPRTVVKKVLPVYPDIARRMQLRGIVKVEVIVTATGAVKSTHVIGGSPLLARSATDAIEKWKWGPAPHDSKEIVELSFHPE
jgi:TonB family protein